MLPRVAPIDGRAPHAAAGAVDTTTSPHLNLKAFSAQARRDATILVAEDHPDSREAIRTLLEAVGYRVLTAADGVQAVDRARREHPDLILMDVMMPLMDGLQATRTLRGTEEGKDIPILAVTAMEGAEELTHEAGCDGYVSKPIQVTAFLSRVAAILNARSTHGSPSGSGA